MPLVRFLPAEIVIEVPAGELLHEAAIRAGVEQLELPCGGTGTCGQCLVELVSGTPTPVGQSALQDALQVGGLVLACQTEVHEDLVVRLPEDRDATLRVVSGSDLLISERLLPARRELSPLCRRERLTVPPASIEEHYSDWLRLVRELGLPAGPVSAELPALRGLAEALRADEGRVTVQIAEDGRVFDVTAGHVGAPALGLAIDVGTTTVSVELVALNDGRVLASRSAYNGQICRGADIITRIDYARSAERLRELSRLVLETVNGLVDEMTEKKEAIAAAFVVGNTTMIHLLLALPPRHIRETPYVPTVNPVPQLTAGEIGLAIHPLAPVRCAPGVGSYVGGDITAGVLCTEMLTRRDEALLFIDVGTNGEIVLGNAEWLVTCACSAGPAFEGSGIKCGMRAAAGAIEHVAIDGEGGLRYDVIGSGKPAGVCGSGLISLLGQLFLRGVVDRSGRLNRELESERVVERGGAPAFLLEHGEGTRDGHDLVITEPDIENLMRTKAAIYAACSLLVENVGLEWSAVSRVYIAGGFGRYIQVEDAVLIGMLPDLPFERFSYLGNSALTGARAALLSAEYRERLDEVAARMTYIDLSSEPRYMDSYMSATFLPHTDIARFPSVARRLNSVPPASGAPIV
jgi:uncharacterized 2Fe-2S/4Fe-4S cluster protein (DUF4445 family)